MTVTMVGPDHRVIATQLEPRSSLDTNLEGIKGKDVRYRTR